METNLMNELAETAQRWRADGQRVALATVAATWGSAPRRAGSKMLVNESMVMAGSVSGGCVESAVVEEALATLKTGRPKLLRYGVSDDTAWEVGLACGGTISVFVEPLPETWWQTITQAAADNVALVTATVLDGDLAGSRVTVAGHGDIVYASPELTDEMTGTLAAVASKPFSGIETVAGYSVMVDVLERRPHLVLIGGVHVGIALQQLARALGMRVTLIDPRRAFATKERFPDVDQIVNAYPQHALPQLELDQDTYIAVLTHDPKIDDPALQIALESNAAYIGVLSSRRTHQLRVERLKAAGVTDEALARIRTPIGLDIGAQTPEEIALAILAEIVAVRRGKA